MTDIAVLGAGQMGAAVVRRLLAGGHRVTVWNRTPAKAATLATAGADVAATPAHAVAGADLVITLLTDAAAVEAALFGSARAALRPDAVVVQMSTIGPDEVRGMAGRLPASVALLDAPVGGSIDAATAGRLTIFVGGPGNIVDLAEPVLRELGTIRRCGPVGAGAALKLVINTAMATALGALHDTLAVADGLRVDRAVALDTLTTGPLGGAVRRATATGASFAIALAGKDMRLALRVVPTAPVAAAALQLLNAAADQGADVASLITVENR